MNNIVEGKFAYILVLLASFDWLIITSSLICGFLGFFIVQHLYETEEADAAAAEKKAHHQHHHQPAAAAEFSVLPHRVPERAVCRGPQVEMRSAQNKQFTDELKMVLVLRRDLKPSELVAASWGATAALELVQHVRARAAEPSISWLRAWNRIGVAKITTRVETNEAMLEVIAAATKKKLLLVGIVENTSSPTSEENGGAPAAASGKKKGGGGSNQQQSQQTKKFGGGEVLIEEELLKTPAGFEPVCIAIGPAPVEEFEGVTSELKLFH